MTVRLRDKRLDAEAPPSKRDEVALILAEDLPKLACGPVVKEFQFAPDRRFKADYALPHIRVLIEIEGGVHGTWDRFGRFSKQQGRHNRSVGYIGDLEKYNLAALLGFRVYRFTPTQVKNGEAMRFLKEACR